MLYKNLVINGKEFKLAVNLTGKGAPTQKTEGQIGSIYMDESSDDKKLYKCTGNLGGSYTWVEFDKNADWGTLLSKPFDKINQAELEVVGMESDRQLGVKAIAKSKVTGLDEKLNEIDQSLLGKQPKGDYSTKTELAEGLDTKVNKTGRTPNKILGVDEGGNVVDIDAPSGIVAQEEAPADTDVLWIDTNDETNPSRIVIDPTLKIEGQAADAKATGDALKKLENLVVYVTKTPLETYTADYNSTEIRNAAISNKKVELRYEDVDTNSGDQVYAFETFKDGEAIFRRNVITATEAYRINIFVDHVGNVRFEKTNLDLSKYALKSEIPEIPVKKMVETTATLDPDTEYIWGEVASLTLDFAPVPDDGFSHDFIWDFVSGASPTTLNLPESIKWAGGAAPKIESGKTYQMLVHNGGGYVVEF